MKNKHDDDCELIDYSFESHLNRFNGLTKDMLRGFTYSCIFSTK